MLSSGLDGIRLTEQDVPNRRKRHGKLEDLTTGAAVRSILPDPLAIVVTIQWFGSEALELTYKDAVNNTALYRSDEHRLAIAEQGRPWSFDGDGETFRFVSEAHRIKLAAGG